MQCKVPTDFLAFDFIVELRLDNDTDNSCRLFRISHSNSKLLNTQNILKLKRFLTFFVIDLPNRPSRNVVRVECHVREKLLAVNFFVLKPSGTGGAGGFSSLN